VCKYLISHVFKCYHTYAMEKAQHQHAAPPSAPATSTNSEGVTVVDINVLLAQPSVQQAIKTLSEKAASAGAEASKK
jgi:hypothetical protein